VRLISLKKNNKTAKGGVPEEVVSDSLVSPSQHIAHELTVYRGLADALPFVPMVGETGYRHDSKCVQDLLIPLQHGNPRQPSTEIVHALASVRSQLAGKVTRNERVYGLVDLTEQGFTLRPQAYADFYCTNGAFGLPVGSNQTLGELLVAEYGGLPPFAAGTGAHTLGVASLVETADGWILLGYRGTKTGVNRGINVPTSGGVQYRDLREGDTLWDLLRETVRIEAQEELGLQTNQYQIVPVGAARECPRGGSPEWFFLLRSTLTHRQFADQYAAHSHADKHEHTELYRVQTEELFAALDSPQPLQNAIHPKAILAALFARRAR